LQIAQNRFFVTLLENHPQLHSDDMPIDAPDLEASPASVAQRALRAIDRYFFALTDLSTPQILWDRTTFLALASLLVIWLFRVYSTWATWGTLSIDSGHEAYVPAMLTQGKMLSRDVFWMYTPLAPYINAGLFRLFGVRLEVLYWAGSFAALFSATLLFLVGKQLSSRLAGWAAGCAVLLEAFHAWHFSFPLPYSFAAVYGCLSACAFLCCAANLLASKHWLWNFAAGSCAAIALMLKMEFGVACYAALFVIALLIARLEMSWSFLLKTVLAALPGLVGCGLVIHWMISIAGASFITQENILSWPTAYFMKVYGKVWLAKTGVALTPQAFGKAALRAIYFVGAVLEAYLIGWWKRRDSRSITLRVALLIALVAYAAAMRWGLFAALAGVFFPRDMVLYVGAATVFALWYFVKRPSTQSATIAGLAVFSTLLAARLLLNMSAGGYPIYYNGPVALAFLIFLRPIVPRAGHSLRIILRSELLLCLGFVGVVAFQSVRLSADPSDLVTLQTARGSIRVPSQVAANYRAAIQFVQDKNRKGELVLSVPEDTSLYFLSGQECPTRIFQFSPGVVAPGKMTSEVIHQLENKNVAYLIWSNRTYPDYGTAVFGVDYDRFLGDYLKARYHEVGPLVPNSDLDWETKFTLWERNAGAPAPHPDLPALQ
jgi:4-amino-4-deoxy-L-arabinose transferase-like glycosyltransferase